MLIFLFYTGLYMLFGGQLFSFIRVIFGLS